MKTAGRIRVAQLAAAALGPIACGSLLPPFASLPEAPLIDPAPIARDIAWLAADARDGRAIGSDGLRQSARYLSDAFEAAGFSKGGDEDSFFSEFEMPVSTRIESAELSIGEEALVRARDFDAFLTSDSGSATGEVVFAGYGITDPENDYDDYENVDVEGRIALVLSDRPAGDGTPAAGHGDLSLVRRSYKFANALRHGAIAVLYAPSLEDAEGVAGSAGREHASPTTQPGGVIALGISRQAAARIVASAGGAPLTERQRSLDESGRPASEVLATRVSIDVSIERKFGRVANVIAVREGTDPRLRGEAVIVGAHYDHLGRGQFSSLAPDRLGEVHNGADDNASGAAGLLALARAFAGEPPGRRTLILAAFTGEEVGLVGSAEYVRNPTFPIADTVAMINLDMIGRLRDGKLTAFGIETSPRFPRLVAKAAAGLPIDVELSKGGYSASDQTSFYSQDVPVLFFFTGSHSEYHTPDDDVELINTAGEADVLRVVYRVVRELLDAPRRPQVIAAQPPSPQGGAGYGPYLGTIPDFGGSDERGVLLQGVRVDSPAEKAGLRSGDRIVEFDGAPIANLEEYAGLLFAARPGQRVEIVVVRDDGRVILEATLGQRR
jgi:aminopeptidase YwaD